MAIWVLLALAFFSPFIAALYFSLNDYVDGLVLLAAIIVFAVVGLIMSPSGGDAYADAQKTQEVSGPTNFLDLYAGDKPVRGVTEFARPAAR